jgi:hypothetical protein
LFAGVILGAVATLLSMGSPVARADQAPAAASNNPTVDKSPTLKAAPASVPARATPASKTAAVQTPAAPTSKTAPVQTTATPASKTAAVQTPVAPTSKTAPVKTAAAPTVNPALARTSAPGLAASSASHPSLSVPARTVSARPGAVTMRAAATPLLSGTTVHGTPGAPRVHLEDRIAYQYNALGRRDPFQPLIDGGFIGVDVGGDAPPDVGGIKVVGIVWGESDKFALVEDGRGNSLVLRPGDKVMNGVVSGLKRDALLVSITADGQTESVAIPLTRKGESNGNR